MTEATSQRGFPLLLAFTVIAIAWSNSPWADSYSSLLDTHLGFSFGTQHFEMTVKHFVNDALMTWAQRHFHRQMTAGSRGPDAA